MAMRCTQALDALSPFLDGQLNGRRLGELDLHLQDCPSCMGELNLLRAADALAQEALPEEPLSPSFIPDLERRIAREGDLPAPAGGLTVRAVIPMAAAVMLGATVTFLGMRLGRQGQTPEQPPVVENDGTPREHAPIAAEYAEALDRTNGFAHRADVVLTNLGQLGADDPKRELEFVQNEAQAVGLKPAMAEAHAAVDVLHQSQEHWRALRLERALKGTDAVLRRLAEDGQADQKLIAARREMLQRQLREVVQGLAPDNLPRPKRRGVPSQPGPAGDDFHAQWHAAFRHYSHGDLAKANALFQKLAVQSTKADEKGRASFWVARTSLLAGKPHITLQQLPTVRAFSPAAAADLSKQMKVIINSGGATIVIAEGEGGDVRLQIEGDLGTEGETEVEINPSAARVAHRRRMEELRKEVAEMQRRMKREFERMPQRQRTEVRKSFETAELPSPQTSHYYFRTTAVRVDGTEVKLEGAPKALRDTTPIIAYRIHLMRPRRVSYDKASHSQVFAFDVWDRPQDEQRKVSRRVQFGSWEAQQFIEALQQATGKTLCDDQRFSTFKTIEFVVGTPARPGRTPARGKRRASFKQSQQQAHEPSTSHPKKQSK